MGWFAKKTYPEFWKAYAACFAGRQKTDLDQLRFVVFDTETTGLDMKKDRILSLGTIGISQNAIKVSDQLECYLEQERFKTETVKIHGLLKKGHMQKMTEEEAVALFLDHIKNDVLVAHHAAFDVGMINTALKRMGLPRLRNPVLDTAHVYKKAFPEVPAHAPRDLDRLATDFQIPMHDRHTASGDAYITALLFLKLVAKLKQQGKVTLRNLTASERIGLL